MAVHNHILNMGPVLVTGATGFIGRALCRRFMDMKTPVRCATRISMSDFYACEVSTVGNINGSTHWRNALTDIRTVVHLAARTHIMKDSAGDPLLVFREINVTGTRRLAEQAAALGVQRLVFLSSVKVNGENTFPGKTFSERDTSAPMGAYGISKWEAEQALWDVAKQTGLEVVVVRPPLVYGPGVKANFARLMSWVRRGIPLPFGSVNNRRSLVGLGNLVDLLVRCTQHPQAAGQTFLVSDGEDLSTPDLIRRLAYAMDRPARLLPFPPDMMFAAACLLGRVAEVERLIGSLQVDMSHTCRTLDWTPPFSVDAELARAVAM